MRPSGFIVGWALDEQCAWRPLDVRVRCDGNWIASGMAYQYREDLLVAGVGTGWCGFSLHTQLDPDEAARSTLYLVDQSGAVITRAERPAILTEDARQANTLADIVTADPTVAGSIEQLRCCDALFAGFVRQHGIEAFVRTTYVYVLGRPADETGLAMYANRLRRGIHTPFELLRILAGSDEFAQRHRTLTAPTQPSFPYLLA